MSDLMSWFRRNYVNDPSEYAKNNLTKLVKMKCIDDWKENFDCSMGECVPNYSYMLSKGLNTVIISQELICRMSLKQLEDYVKLFSY